MKTVLDTDALVIGGGPAGLSAGLMLGRACRRTVIVDAGQPRNAPAQNMHGFISQENVAPLRFLQIARSDLRLYPNVRILSTSAQSVAVFEEGFAASLATGETIRAKRLLLANGVCDQLPNIAGLADFWGRSVFVCPFCDGWEVKGLALGVSGEAESAVSLAHRLYGWSQNLTLFVDERAHLTAAQERWLAASGSTLVREPVKQLEGKNGRLDAVCTQSGRSIECQALFLSAPLYQACSLAQSLGCKFSKDGAVAVDGNLQTSVRGCYAAGDAIAKIHQIVLAAASGAQAAISLCDDLLSEEAGALVETTPQGRQPCSCHVLKRSHMAASQRGSPE